MRFRLTAAVAAMCACGPSGSTEPAPPTSAGAVASLEASASAAPPTMSASAATTASATPSAPRPEPVTFQPAAHEVGFRAEGHITMTTTLEVDHDGKKVRIVETTSDETVYEIVRVKEGVATELGVRYVRSRRILETDGRFEDLSLPLEGRTFAVTGTGKAVVVRALDAKPVPKPVREKLERQFRFVGKPTPMQKHLPREPIQPGESVPGLVAALRETLASPDPAAKVTLESLEVVYRGLSDEGAAFELKGNLVTKTGDTTIRNVLRGPLVLEVPSGILVRIESEGPVEVEMKGAKTGGTLKASETLRVLR